MTGLIPGWFPPSREHYEKILLVWKIFPLAGYGSQQLTSWYGMGKTSVTSRLNLPGWIGWMLMELPGACTLLYHMNTLPAQNGITDLPWQNKVLAALFVIHYSYRAVMYPLLQPSMSPIHVFVFLAAMVFQVFNGTCLGAWLGAYGPTTQEAWREQLGPGGLAQFTAGIALFYVGLAANFYHDEELREIRRREMARQERLARKAAGAEGKKVPTIEKHYEIPNAGLFKYMLYPHYFVEWVEWFGFWMACGWSSAPARCFVVAEVASMVPRAVSGKKWYVEKFGEEKIKGRWAVIPGVV